MTPDLRLTGKYPRFSPDGRFLARVQLTAKRVIVVDLATRKDVLTAPGNTPPFWIGPQTVTWRSESKGLATRYEASAPAWTVQPRDIARGVGFLAAPSGHWMRWVSLAAGGTVFWDNVPDPIRIKSGCPLALDGSLLVGPAERDDKPPHPLWVSRDGVDVPGWRIANPGRRPYGVGLWQDGAGAWLAYGGHGPVLGRRMPDGAEIDLCVTPWRHEGLPCVVPYLGLPWLVTASRSRSHPARVGVYVRPWASHDAIVIEDAQPADVESLHAVATSNGEAIHVAMATATGKCVVWTVAATAAYQVPS